SKNTLVAMKYQLKATFMESAYAGSITDAPAADSSISITSVPLSRRLAENPPDTPAKGAARPASGCLPSARYNSAPSGGSTTYAEAEDTDDMIPAKTSRAVIRLLGIDRTKPLSTAPISPERYATPITSIETSTTPSGAKLMKLSVMLSNM